MGLTWHITVNKWGKKLVWANQKCCMMGFAQVLLILKNRTRNRPLNKKRMARTSMEPVLGCWKTTGPVLQKIEGNTSIQCHTNPCRSHRWVKLDLGQSCGNFFFPAILGIFSPLTTIVSIDWIIEWIPHAILPIPTLYFNLAFLLQFLIQLRTFDNPFTLFAISTGFHLQCDSTRSIYLIFYHFIRSTAVVDPPFLQ